MLTLIIRYTGNLQQLAEEIGFEAEELLAGYAVIVIRQELAPLLLLSNQVLYTEIPARVYTETLTGKRASCITVLQNRNPQLTGKGVLVGIIDTGIDYSHPDFRNEDGTTRIEALWDQTAVSSTETGDRPPEGYSSGVLYQRERINSALFAENAEERAIVVPEFDAGGHGTHVAGIAAGNGRASNGLNRGVAFESELLIVKLGGTQADPFPQTPNLMTAVDFCVRYAAEAGKPLALNLSFGNNDGAHDGKSLLETYLDEVTLYGRNSICIGTGNEAAAGRHVGGLLVSGQETEIALNVGATDSLLQLGLWTDALDVYDITIQAPSGETREMVGKQNGNGVAIKGYPVAGGETYRFGNTQVEVFSLGAVPYRRVRETAITMRGNSGQIQEGTWRFRLRPTVFLRGEYDIWLSGGVRNELTRFLSATPERTLTIPSTAGRAIAVAAYDSRTDGLTTFSGRGYPRGNGEIKPDLSAPGVNVLSCAPNGGYTLKTGTSMATPFVTGSCALLMQWGIVLRNDPYLYAERLKSALIEGARRLNLPINYPNRLIGFGALCTNDSLPE